jgi:hypothetical protein
VTIKINSKSIISLTPLLQWSAFNAA